MAFETQQPTRPHAAFVAIFTVSAATVAATQVTKSAQRGLHAPFFVMYVHISMMALWLPAAKALANDTRVMASLPDVLLFLPLWVASNYCFVVALAHAPPGLVQTLFGTGPAIVALLSRAFLLEAFSLLRLLAVGLAFAGTAAVAVGSGGWSTHSGNDGGSDLLIGGAYALIAVLTSASYKVAFKLRLGEPPISVVLGFVGTLGLAAAILGLPIAIFLAAMGIEDRWWDDNVSVNWALVLASAAVDVVYNTSMTCGLAVSSPVFIALGVILGTPANLLLDAMVRGVPLGGVEACGAALIVASFALLAVRPTLGASRSRRSWT